MNFKMEWTNQTITDVKRVAQTNFKKVIPQNCWGMVKRWSPLKTAARPPCLSQHLDGLCCALLQTAALRAVIGPGSASGQFITRALSFVMFMVVFHVLDHGALAFHYACGHVSCVLRFPALKTAYYWFVFQILKREAVTAEFFFAKVV